MKAGPTEMSSTFDDWVGGRTISSVGTNAGATPIGFQSWHRFKEAFPPELIRTAVLGTPIDPVAVLDPFGGSGTTALASQFLGISSTSIEVNPFLADVIRAKVEKYDVEALSHALGRLSRNAHRLR